MFWHIIWGADMTEVWGEGDGGGGSYGGGGSDSGGGGNDGGDGASLTLLK